MCRDEIHSIGSSDVYLVSDFLGNQKAAFLSNLKKSCSWIYLSSTDDTVPKGSLESTVPGVIKRWSFHHFSVPPKIWITGSDFLSALTSSLHVKQIQKDLSNIR